MRTIALILMLALAGCAGPAQEMTAQADDQPLEYDEPVDIVELQLFVTAATVTREETIVLNGSTNHDATVTVGTSLDAGAVNGTWSVEVPVEPGHNNITVTADDGHQTVQRSVQVIREVMITFDVVYRGDVGLEDTSDEVWYDPDGMASLEAYAGCGQAHPDYANVHDVMVSWEDQTGHVVGYGECGDFGVPVNDINGHESPGFWCYEVNGEAPEVGISLQEVVPGDHIVWDDCALVLG